MIESIKCCGKEIIIKDQPIKLTQFMSGDTSIDFIFTCPECKEDIIIKYENILLKNGTIVKYNMNTEKPLVGVIFGSDFEVNYGDDDTISNINYYVGIDGIRNNREMIHPDHIVEILGIESEEDFIKRNDDNIKIDIEDYL